MPLLEISPTMALKYITPQLVILDKGVAKLILQLKFSPSFVY